MFIVAYDFTNNKVRSRFSKFLKKFGRKIQFSVYEIKNSQRILQNILDEVELRYKKQFRGSDSILIFQICEDCKKKIIKYGYAKNEEKEVVFFNWWTLTICFFYHSRLTNKGVNLCAGILRFNKTLVFIKSKALF